jgi:S1-C subfamily serine protease
MLRMGNPFNVIIVLVAIFFVSACVMSPNVAKMDEATAANLKAEVTVYDSKKLNGLEYETVRNIEATACGNKEAGINQLRAVAHSAGANGIIKIKCDRLLGPGLMQNCMTPVMCEAVAITVGKADVAQEKRMEERKIEQPSAERMTPAPEGEGFTLGKLPAVVTTFDATGGSNNVEIIFSGNYVAKGKVVKLDRVNNLAIITFEEFRRMPAGFQIFPSYRVRSGQNIYLMSNAHADQSGKNVSITEGSVSAVEGPDGDSRYFRIATSGRLPKGGSPVLDAQGRVVGIASPAFNRMSSQAETGGYLALKSTVLLDLYPDMNTLVTSESGPPLTSQQILELYSSSVVTITPLRQ